MGLLTWLESKLPKTTITVAGKPYLTRCYLFGKDRAWGNIYLHHFHSSDQGDELHNHPWSWGLSLVLAGGYHEERARDPFVWRSDEQYDPDSVAYFGPPPKDNVFPSVPIERREVRPGAVNLIRSTDFHRVDLRDETKGAWTIFFAGPRSKDWGFLNRHTSEFTDWRRNPEAIP